MAERGKIAHDFKCNRCDHSPFDVTVHTKISYNIQRIRMVALKFRKASQKGATRAYDMLAARTRIFINKNHVRMRTRQMDYILCAEDVSCSHRAVCLARSRGIFVAGACLLSISIARYAHRFRGSKAYRKNHYSIKRVDWSRPEWSENKFVFTMIFHKQTECALCIRT